MKKLRELRSQLIEFLFNPKYSRWLAPLLLLVDGALTAAIVRVVPCEFGLSSRRLDFQYIFGYTDKPVFGKDTEIDWVAYMQQIKTYRLGERDYANIEGQTGPLVYPAAHVYIYDILYRVTDAGSNIFRARCIFALVYLAALSMAMACYRAAKAPPYLFVLLILSKRLHSIFVLRLFNDCFAVLCLFSAVFLYQTGLIAFGSLMFSLAIGIKMSILLAAPGVGVMLLQLLPSHRALNMVMIMLQLQIVLAVPFISVNPWSYLGRAFQLSRQFLFKWTVNWRFLGEEWFLSSTFAASLLLANVTLLATFTLTRWTRPSGLKPWDLAKTVLRPLPPKFERIVAKNVTSDFIMTTILTSLVIGLLCARTLHYQFFAYISWTTPYLLWKSRLSAPFILILWTLQEIAWNIYPSTKSSSLIVVASLALQVLGVWWGTRHDSPDASFDGSPDTEIDDKKVK